MKTRLLSNMTIAPLTPHLEGMNVSIGEFTSLLLELVDPRSVAASADVTHVLCVFDTDTLLGAAAYDADAPSEAETFVDALDSFAESHPDKIVVVTTFCTSTARAQTFTDTIAVRSPRTVETLLNGRLIDTARRLPNVLLLDIEPLFRRFGEEQLLSTAFWYAGRIRYTPKMLRLLGSLISDGLAAFGNRARKVLVLDLDNTLWGGIVGETGAQGVALSESGKGACYRDFQRAIRALKSTGTLLAICSKNNPADVDEVFETNTMMVLRREDFAAMRVNWEPKPDNLADLAQALNLGLDSFVFLDDNPVERAAISSAFPEVAVPAFPERPEALRRWFVDDVVRPYFSKYRITNEDFRKTEQYRAGEARRSFARSFDLDTFITGLQIAYTLHVDEPATIVRASQMTQKTNQFNLTTLRCEIPEIARYVEDDDLTLIALEYEDRFGAEGIVALTLLDLGAARIDNILMSCRVIGRRVENRLLQAAMDRFRARGVREVYADYVATKKNGIVASFYDDHGFAVIAEEGSGRKTYQCIIP